MALDVAETVGCHVCWSVELPVASKSFRYANANQRDVECVAAYMVELGQGGYGKTERRKDRRKEIE